MNDENPHEFSRPVSVLDIPSKGLRQRLEASRDECEALAARLGVDTVLRLAAILEVKPWRSTGLCVSGTVDAEVVQTCVVTLEPVTNALSGDILVYLVREAVRGARPVEREVFVDPLADEEPEVLQGNILDLGELAVEHAILAVDSYPRIDGSQVPPPRDAYEDEPGPFAALAALRQGEKDD